MLLVMATASVLTPGSLPSRGLGLMTGRRACCCSALCARPCAMRPTRLARTCFPCMMGGTCGDRTPLSETGSGLSEAGELANLSCMEHGQASTPTQRRQRSALRQQSNCRLLPHDIRAHLGGQVPAGRSGWPAAARPPGAAAAACWSRGRCSRCARAPGTAPPPGCTSEVTRSSKAANASLLHAAFMRLSRYVCALCLSSRTSGACTRVRRSPDTLSPV